MEILFLSKRTLSNSNGGLTFFEEIVDRSSGECLNVILISSLLWEFRELIGVVRLELRFWFFTAPVIYIISGV